MASRGTVAPSGSQDVARVPTTVRDMFFEDPHFMENWTDFDKVKDAMFKESRDLWKKMDEDFRKTRCMAGNILASEPGEGLLAIPRENKDPISRYESSWMFPRRWMMPALSGQNQLTGMDLFKAGHDHEVIRVKEDENQLEVSLDTSHYRPDELHVSVSDGMVTIEGKHVEKSEDGKKTLSRHFRRRYTLPEGVRSENVTSDLASDGVLVVHARKAGHGIKEVPIKQIK